MTTAEKAARRCLGPRECSFSRGYVCSIFLVCFFHLPNFKYVLNLNLQLFRLPNPTFAAKWEVQFSFDYHMRSAALYASLSRDPARELCATHFLFRWMHL